MVSAKVDFDQRVYALSFVMGELRGKEVLKLVITAPELVRMKIKLVITAPELVRIKLEPAAPVSDTLKYQLSTNRNWKDSGST